MIIFGIKTRSSKIDDAEVLKSSCPSCKGDLELHDLKKWFTLYFIPVIPLNKIESYYKCVGCSQTYKEAIKDMLGGSEKDRAKAQEDAKKAFATTLAACMTRMAKIDGTISKKEKQEITKISGSKAFSKYKKDVEKTIEKVSRSKDDEEVFEMLRKAKATLTADAVFIIIGQVARVVLADGKIDKKEEALMKEFLLACGIPRDIYGKIIDKVRESMAKEAKK